MILIKWMFIVAIFIREVDVPPDQSCPSSSDQMDMSEVLKEFRKLQERVRVLNQGHNKLNRDLHKLREGQNKLREDLDKLREGHRKLRKEFLYERSHLRSAIIAESYVYVKNFITRILHFYQMLEMLDHTCHWTSSQKQFDVQPGKLQNRFCSGSVACLTVLFFNRKS